MADAPASDIAVTGADGTLVVHGARSYEQALEFYRAMYGWTSQSPIAAPVTGYLRLPPGQDNQ